jgi:RND family efflux transporter MFP subunit
MKNTASILIILFSVLTACKQNYQTTDKNTENTVPVVVEKPEPLTEPLKVHGSGVLASKKESNLSFKITGFIEKIPVTEGEKVRKGKLLAILDQREINSQVAQAERALEKAERDLKRIQELYADSAATLEQLQDLTTVYEVASFEYDVAKYNQEHSAIFAPSNGRILKSWAEEEELIEAGSPVLTFASSGEKELILRIGVADKDVIMLKLGDEAEIIFDAYPQTIFPAHVSEIAEAADPRTGTFEIEITLDDPQKDLKNGFIGKVTITPSKKQSLYKIPMNALIEGTSNSATVFAYSEKDNRATRITLRPVKLSSDHFLVRSVEIENMEWVITRGAAYVNENSNLKVVSTL